MPLHNPGSRTTWHSLQRQDLEYEMTGECSGESSADRVSPQVLKEAEGEGEPSGQQSNSTGQQSAFGHIVKGDGSTTEAQGKQPQRPRQCTRRSVLEFRGGGSHPWPKGKQDFHSKTHGVNDRCLVIIFTGRRISMEPLSFRLPQDLGLQHYLTMMHYAESPPLVRQRLAS
jgi:hypothetical protein